MKTFHVLTIFPQYVQAVFEYGVLRQAADGGLINGNLVDLRDFTDDRHRSTDDAPYGGGPGMVMLCDPIFRAVDALRAEHGPLPLIYLGPAGERFTHRTAVELAQGEDFILLCGRYEGIDQRVLDHLVDREISLGDSVLSGAELAAQCVIDAVARQIPGVLGNSASLPEESFATGLLDWPHYTRPEEYRGFRVPEVLISGHHAKIISFRQQAAILLTYKRRPELLTERQRQEAEGILRQQQQEGQDDATVDSKVPGGHG